LFFIHTKGDDMARISSELAARAVGSKYDLILIGARRARELNRGWRPTVTCDNGAVVTALREIEAGNIGRDYLLKPPNLDRRERPPQEEQ
jgi:DNA-directed RNA polymerase subunit omega